MDWRTDLEEIIAEMAADFVVRDRWVEYEDFAAAVIDALQVQHLGYQDHTANGTYVNVFSLNKITEHMRPVFSFGVLKENPQPGELAG